MRAALVPVTIGWLIAGGGALAGEQYSATIDVNIRSGPGANYPILEILHAGETIAAKYCDGSWCRVVAHGGSDGWVTSRFLSSKGEAADKAVVDPSLALDANIPIATTTASVPDVGSPGSVLLPDAARKYVATHRPLSIELVDVPMVGGSIPRDIRLRDIPGSHYQYVYVDGRPVIVDGQSRRIVQVEP